MPYSSQNLGDPPKRAVGPDDSYWVTIEQDSRILGGGFLLSPAYVLTAAHCVREAWAADRPDVQLAGAGRSAVPAQVIEVLPEPDLALVEVAGLDFAGVGVPDTDRCQKDDLWSAPYRPSDGDALLYGFVENGEMDFQAASGALIRALQLRANSSFGDYSGYSGGPVERHASGSRTLVGLLIEQYPDRHSPDRAAPVLFAATIQEALRQFTRFRDLLQVATLFGETAAPERSVLSDTAKLTMAKADQVLEYLRDGVQAGTVDIAVSCQMQVKVLNRVIEEALE